MIRKFVGWLLHILHIKRRQEIDIIQTLNELMPMLFAAMAIIGAVIQYRQIFPVLSWYMRIWQNIKFCIRRMRIVVIGY